MFSNWGYVYFHLGQGLGCIEIDLESYRKAPAAGGRAQASTIAAHNPIVHALRGHLSNVETMAKFQELGTIPRDAEILKAKIEKAVRQNPATQLLSTDEILADVQRIRKDCLYILQKRKFYSISPEFLSFYGMPQLFGTAVAKKFPRAQSDIEWAGNCLALGQPTACVLHLDRAMEIATRRLAGKLKVTPNPKDSWGMVLGKMTDPIKRCVTIPLPRNVERKSGLNVEQIYITSRWHGAILARTAPRAIATKKRQTF